MCTVLIIEDEETVMYITRTMLEVQGFNILEAKTGEEALHLANTYKGDIDLVVLDIFLPDMNGNKVYPLLIKALPKLKVIVCSGYSLDSRAQEVLVAGAQCFIQKPFPLTTLSEKLDEVLKD